MHTRTQPALAITTAIGLATAAQGQTVSPAAPIAAQPVTIDFTGTEIFDELDTMPSPFLDRRLQVIFTAPSGAMFDVPGYFFGNGLDVAAAPPTLTGTGSAWRVRFTPTEPGMWTWQASFTGGGDVAIDRTAIGIPLDFDGASGSFDVDPIDPSAPGFFAKGKLLHNDTHYLTFTNGDRYIKGGVDSPENWLGYSGFDNTFDGGGADVNTPDDLHAFPTHIMDWNPGDPDWDSPDTPQPNDGRGIIGAINYLASTGVNSIYFLPMNIGGDAQDTWPYGDPAIDGGGNINNNNFAFDITKLAQWEIVFNHAQAKGLLLHFVLNEAEAPNKQELDDATLGPERRLFYREMIARFGYLPAIQWNISEEYNLNLNLGAATVLEFAAELKAVDPYSTPVAVHNAGSAQPTGALEPFIGQADIDLPSIQQARKTNGWGEVVENWRNATAAAGKPLPVMVDEPGSPTRDFGDDFDQFRKQVIWPILASGGGGEWFINNRDQSLEDFREFDKIWRETGHAVRFFESNVPFWLMAPADSLVSGASAAEAGSLDGVEVLARSGFEYVIYYPDASDTGTLDLTGVMGTATARWYNPRSGAFEAGSSPLSGGSNVSLPAAPSPASDDWTLLVLVDDPMQPEQFTLTVENGTGDGDYTAGQVVGIAATIPPGMGFDQWIGLPVANPFSATTTLVMPAMDATVTATFDDMPDGPAVIGLTLIDPAIDAPITSLDAFPVIYRSDLTNPQELNIRAEVTPETSSVSFAIDGTTAGTENVAPFALFGDSSGDFNAGNLANGTRTITATAGGGAAFSLDVLVADEPCQADLTTTGATLPGDDRSGIPDGIADLDDLGFFLNHWLAGQPSADMTTSGATLNGQPGFATADGVVDLDDLGYFLGLWLGGCP
ncbi:MAG: GC-type dockerin domain-anchored protein [Planctomycetota bacterium]